MSTGNTNVKYPRILVISNNPFSDTSNNGKTLASFFKDFPVGNISQLYFSLEEPDNTHYNNYFKITDNDIIRSLLKKSDTCGEIIDFSLFNTTIQINKNKSHWVNHFKKYNVSRIVREILWTSKKWNTRLLNQWLKEISPEIIFLCAGDSGFAYDITKYIKERTGAKLVVYITDDYVLPRKTLSPFWWLRRNYILNKMRYIIQRSDLFITVSKEMKEEYKKLFGKDSMVAVNMTESMRDKSVRIKRTDFFTLVYAGGLHYKRYLTLSLLAQSLRNYNIESKQKAHLKIYSSQEPTRKILKYLNIDGASEFCGSLNAEQLKEVLNSGDMLVHVESFDRKCIESTRLSISTKIPEYLSLGKPVLAIGPKQVASMEYLEDSAFCITDKNKIYPGLQELFSNDDLLKRLSMKAMDKYERNHKREVVVNNFLSHILEMYNKDR